MTTTSDMNWRTTTGRVSPLSLGIGISGTFIVIFLVLETWLGRWDALRADGNFSPFARVSTGVLRDVRLALVHCLLIGYLPAAFLLAMRNGRWTVLKLQKALQCTREECVGLAELVTLDKRWLLIMGVLGVSLAIVTPYVVPPVPIAPWSPSNWNPEIAWHRILGPPILVCLCWLGYAVVTVSMRLSRLAGKLQRVDLLDLSALAPFTRAGLTNSLLLIGALSISSLMLIETGFGATILLIGAPALVVAVLALVSPVRGVHKRIRQAKDVELQRINSAIATNPIATPNPETDQRRGELADLVAYRSLIENVPEWPFTTSTYARVTLYVFIPAVSWSLGIAAEEIVSRFLF